MFALYKWLTVFFAQLRAMMMNPSKKKKCYDDELIQRNLFIIYEFFLRFNDWCPTNFCLVESTEGRPRMKKVFVY